ncbi:hydrophobic surface binding protein, partial [Infundibulicybe gibba]
ASLVLTGFAAPNAKRTVAQVEADIATISAQVTTWDNAINAFTVGNLIQVLTIHTDATALVTDINTGTTDVEAAPTPIAESDGQAILTAIQNLEPGIIKSLQDIATRGADFAALPIGGIPALICQDLKNIQTGVDVFLSVLIAVVPANIKAEITTFKNTIDAAFAAALQA